LTSVRDMVHEAQRELLKGDPTPERSRGLLVKLTSILANVRSLSDEMNLAR
jgi:hypothetical protein